jgi:hypothetical protein
MSLKFVFHAAVPEDREKIQLLRRLSLRELAGLPDLVNHA